MKIVWHRPYGTTSISLRALIAAAAKVELAL